MSPPCEKKLPHFLFLGLATWRRNSSDGKVVVDLISDSPEAPAVSTAATRRQTTHLSMLLDDAVFPGLLDKVRGTTWANDEVIDCWMEGIVARDHPHVLYIAWYVVSVR